MSNLTISDLTFITREDLSATLLFHPLQTRTLHRVSIRARLLQLAPLPSNIAIIDVRDGDHIGGHIRGSTWVPTADLDFKLPELVRELKGKDTVVFHCASSQRRGPSAALRYFEGEGEVGGGGGEGGRGGGRRR